MKKKKIVLYDPSSLAILPLALIAIASVLNKDKYEIKIVHKFIHDDEYVIRQVKDAFCLGVTVLTGPTVVNALRLCQTIKKQNPNLPIVWGGWHTSLFPEMCVQEEAIDIGVVGLGESTFPKILQCIEENKTLETIPGCVVKRYNGSVVVNENDPIKDINTFDRHDYSLVDVEEYFQKKGSRTLEYITSRGCPGRCNFCVEPVIYGKKWMPLHAKRVVKEINHLYSTYKFSNLSLQDDNFFTNKKRLYEIAEGFLTNNLNFNWSGTLRADQGRRIENDLFALLKKSGLRTVIIGMESGSQKTLDHIQKDTNLNDLWNTVEKLRKHKIRAIINFIVGFPGESSESIRETLEVIRELKAINSNFKTELFTFRYFPGVTLQNISGKEHWPDLKSLEELDYFDISSTKNRWLSSSQQKEIFLFKQYLSYAYRKDLPSFFKPLMNLSRWRLNNLYFKFSLDLILARFLLWQTTPIVQGDKD